jgi:hypothetical protein
MVQGPAIALIVIGIIGILFHLAMAGLSFLGSGFSALAGGSRGVGSALSGAVGGVVYIVWALLEGLVVFGGVKMKSMQSWGLAVAAAVVALLPCTNWICCLLGMPIGIWALVVLMNDEVKRSFQG